MTQAWLYAAVLAVAVAEPASGQWQQGEPTREEIAEAYRSKSGEHCFVIPGICWETWNIKRIRDWSLKLKRLGEERSAGLRIRRYRVIAKKGGQCAEYLIVDTMSFPPVNVQIKSSLTVEPKGVKECK